MRFLNGEFIEFVLAISDTSSKSPSRSFSTMNSPTSSSLLRSSHQRCSDWSTGIDWVAVRFLWASRSIVSSRRSTVHSRTWSYWSKWMFAWLSLAREKNSVPDDSIASEWILLTELSSRLRRLSDEHRPAVYRSLWSIETVANGRHTHTGRALVSSTNLLDVYRVWCPILFGCLCGCFRRIRNAQIDDWNIGRDRLGEHPVLVDERRRSRSLEFVSRIVGCNKHHSTPSSQALVLRVLCELVEIDCSSIRTNASVRWCNDWGMDRSFSNVSISFRIDPIGSREKRRSFFSPDSHSRSYAKILDQR